MFVGSCSGSPQDHKRYPSDEGCHGRQIHQSCSPLTICQQQELKGVEEQGYDDERDLKSHGNLQVGWEL